MEKAVVTASMGQKKSGFNFMSQRLTTSQDSQKHWVYNKNRSQVAQRGRGAARQPNMVFVFFVCLV